MSPPLVLVDPPPGPFWPLAAARPVADLLAGARTFRARWAARADPPAAILCAPAVLGCAFRSGRPPVLNRWPEPEGGYRLALATWVPPAGWSFGDGPAEFRSAGEPVAWRLDGAAAKTLTSTAEASPEELPARLAGLRLPPVETGGLHPGSIWEVMAASGELLAADAALVASDPSGAIERVHDEGSRALSAATGGASVAVLGDGLRLGPGASIGPFAVLDSRDGPIVLDRDARIGPHAVCRGPLYVGAGSAVLGGHVGPAVSIGPACKVRGEVEASIFQGYANKAHDGFVGHSVLGEWVNLGAGTVTSDLKNTYGPVRVSGPEGRIETGLLKAGAFLGDHVRTGIGTLLGTGARIGLGSHVFGGRGVSPAWLPEFSWYDGEERRPVRLEPFLGAARAAMARRGQVLTDAEAAMLAALHSRGRAAVVR